MPVYAVSSSLPCHVGLFRDSRTSGNQNHPIHSLPMVWPVLCSAGCSMQRSALAPQHDHETKDLGHCAINTWGGRYTVFSRWLSIHIKRRQVRSSSRPKRLVSSIGGRKGNPQPASSAAESRRDAAINQTKASKGTQNIGD